MVHQAVEIIPVAIAPINNSLESDARPHARVNRTSGRWKFIAPCAWLALDPQALGDEAVHALLRRIHIADPAIHGHAGKRIGIEPRERFLLLQKLDHAP